MSPLALPLQFHPVTPARLPELTRFMAKHGKFRYCACMRWRMTSSEFNRSTRESRAATLERLARAGTPIGVLACLDQEPVGWCSVAPREQYAGLERYRALPRIDERPVWSVACFFVSATLRRRRMTFGILKAAVDYAGTQGAEIVEGYPVDPGPPLYTYMGSPATFRTAGFTDVTPCGQTRRVMRYFFKAD